MSNLTKRQHALDRACREVAPRHDDKICHHCWMDYVPHIRAAFARILAEQDDPQVEE